MPTPSEHRALIFVAIVAVLGVWVRGCGKGEDGSAVPLSDREALAVQLRAVDSALASGGRRGSASQKSSGATKSVGAGASAGAGSTQGAGISQPGSPALKIDLDRAGADELNRLPGIGPALASRIVADREANGPFGSIEEFQRVRGVGPALSARIAPHVTFSAPPRHK